MDVVPDDAVVLSGGHRLADREHETRFPRILQELQNFLALRIVRQIADPRCAVVMSARVRVLLLHTQHQMHDLSIRKYEH